MLKLLQLKVLKVGQWEKPCIGFTQKNLIKSSIQDCLLYILEAHGLCTTFLACSNNYVLASRSPSYTIQLS